MNYTKIGEKKSMELNFTEKRILITAFFCMSFTIANLITVKIIDIKTLQTIAIVKHTAHVGYIAGIEVSEI